MDVVSAYLTSEFYKEDKEIYMDFFKGMLIREGDVGKVCRILKSLYGFK